MTDRNHVEVGRAGHSRTDPPRFVGRALDDAPLLLEQSYRLRYTVYCLERKFLPAEAYPAGLEIDEFDGHSLHVGALDPSGAVAGTSRAVKASATSLPLFDHCTSFPHETEFTRGNPRLVEVGRLVVDRRYRRRENDVLRNAGNSSTPGHISAYDGRERRRVGEDVFMTVLQILYEETRRIGATHWLTAMQEPLRQQLVQHGFPFRAFGPEGDYFGPVIPYQMALQELDDVILSGRFPGLAGFAAASQPEPGVPAGVGAGTEPDDVLPGATDRPTEGP